MLDKYLNDVKRWAAAPYRENGDLLDWFLFIGLLTVATVLWSRVIKRVANVL